MKLSHLTFGQLYKLQHPTTLMRVTRVYHTALRTAFNRNYPPTAEFSVLKASRAFPSIVRRYKKVLDLLTGPELKRATRLAALNTRIPFIPGGRQIVRVCDYWTPYQEKEQFQLARLCVEFCAAVGVPAKIQRTPGAYTVRADTNHLGAAALRRHPGLPVFIISQFLEDGNVPLNGPFWWLPTELYQSARVNPLLRCINTPDYQSYAKEIIFNF